MTDELKPVRCGCGGEAKVSTWTGTMATTINDCNVVYCETCGTQTKRFKTESEAIEVWNRAMGAKDINVPNKTAKVTTVEKPIEGSARTISVMACENCENVVSIFDKYCSGCGARLEWK